MAARTTVQVARGRRVEVQLCVKEELMAGQRQLGSLAAAYLPDAAVASVGPPGQLAAAAGSVTVLDLQACEAAYRLLVPA